jgi:tetratricopeptide (TPR) repeat protein
MNGRGFVAAACIVFGAGTAWAIDDRVLGRDDVEFAEGLVENRYGDLAERFVEVIERQDGEWFRRSAADVRPRYQANPELWGQDERRADYVHARTVQLHAMALDRTSPNRRVLLDQALREFEEVDLDAIGEAPSWLYRSYLYCGQCLDGLGRTREAIESFDRLIALRRSFGDADPKTGVYPAPAAAVDVVDLVCDAVRAKVRVLAAAGKTADAVAAGRDYFATMARPFDAANAETLASDLRAAERDLATQDARVAALSAEGDRLFAEGRRVNGVPESRVTFADWTPPEKLVAQPWVDAAHAYETALARSDDYRIAIRLGRTYGYLQLWTDAARVYAKVFENEPILTQNKQKLDREYVKSKPESKLAYLEWGVAERLAAKGVRDEAKRDERLNLCINRIFMPLNFSVSPDRDGAVYWATMYHVVRALMDKGLYQDARCKCEDLLRSVDGSRFDDGKFGYQKLFEATLKELR